MELEVCVEIRWRKLPCRSTTMAELQSNWNLLLFVFTFISGRVYLRNTSFVFIFISRAYIICVVISITLMLFNNTEIKYIYLLITAISMCYFLFFHIYLYFLISLSLFSVFSAQMSTMNTDTVGNHMNPMVSCQILLLLDLSCVNYQNINF